MERGRRWGKGRRWRKGLGGGGGVGGGGSCGGGVVVVMVGLVEDRFILSAEPVSIGHGTIKVKLIL